MWWPGNTIPQGVNGAGTYHLINQLNKLRVPKGLSEDGWRESKEGEGTLGDDHIGADEGGSWRK